MNEFAQGKEVASIFDRYRLVLILCLTAMPHIYCLATDYYFSSTEGDDSRTAMQAQDPATPWKTINKLNTVFPDLQPGDRILFKRGEVFKGGMIINRSGTQQAPIILTAYGAGGNPVISGFFNINEWTSRGNGVYESVPFSAESTVNMVVINGRNYAMGRYPNADATNSGYLTLESHSNTSITDNQLPAAPNWSGAELVLRNTRWIIDRAPITRHSGKTLYYDNDRLYYSPSDGFGYFIQNDIRTLDQFGEWYYNPAKNTLSVYFGSAGPAGQVVQVTTVDKLVALQASHILLENLTFAGANQYGVYNKQRLVSNAQIKNCQFFFSGIDAIHNTYSYDFRVENCTIHHSNNNAIFMGNGCPRAQIRNNDIRNTGMQPGMGQNGDGNYIALYNRAAGFVVENNKILNTGYIGIHFSGNSTLVKNNYIDTFCVVKDDGAGIYSYIGETNNTTFDQKVLGNIVLNGIGAPYGTNEPDYLAAEGIYLDDAVNHVDVLDNTVAHCGNSGIFLHNARDFNINGNTIYDNSVQLLIIRDYPKTPVTGVVTDNIFFAKNREDRVAFFSTLDDDIADFGVFSNNYYARPLDDDLTITVVTNAEGPGYSYREYDLAGWQAAYGKDEGSKKSPIEIPAYTLIGLSETNKYPNGTFDDNINGLYCWSQEVDCEISWVGAAGLDGGALEVRNATASRVVIPVEATDASKQYILRFSAIAQRESTVEIYLRQWNAPWQIISKVHKVRISPERNEYEVLFSYPSSANAVGLELATRDPQLTYWLDNVGLYEAEAVTTKPDDHIIFAYNETPDDKTVPLNGKFIDVKYTLYQTGLALPSFESVILLECDDCGCDLTDTPCDDGDACTENDVYDADCNCAGKVSDSDGDGVCDADDLCPGGDDTVDSDGDGIPDDCDECQTGASCDDGNPSTSDDVYDVDCNCVGVPCPSAGTACDDGDRSTTNDIEDGNCNCSGTRVSDDYCSSFGQITTAEWIEAVVINGIKYQSGNDLGYGNYTGSPVNIANGAPISLELHLGTENKTTLKYWRVWIDFDQNGLLNDTGELIFEDSSRTEAHSFQVQIPEVREGELRMRVSMQWAAFPGPCDTIPWGEVEDYTLKIGPICPMAGTACDDGDPSTTDDVEDGACNCVGTPCPTAGTVCDDGDPSTTDDVEDGACNCVGSPCATAGTACDDGDSLTTGDVEDGNCNCAGVDVYCPSYGEITEHEWIEAVHINSVEFVSGNNGGYKRHADTPVFVEPGTSVPLELHLGIQNPNYVHYWRVWIDFDRNGQFADEGELVFETNDAQAVHTTQIDIPPGLSGSRRMRVSMQWGGYAGACDLIGWGEVEDFTLDFGLSQARVVPPSTEPLLRFLKDERIDLPEPAVRVYPNPARDHIFLDYRNVPVGKVWFQIWNSLGQRVAIWEWHNELSDGIREVNLPPDLSRGGYYITLQWEGKQISKRILLE